jgi:hypothetical protein
VGLDPDAMTDAIEAAYKLEWSKKKPNPLPDAGRDDRRLIFAGVARGVLQYLHDHQNEFLTTLKIQDENGLQAAFQVQETDLGINV